MLVVGDIDGVDPIEPAHATRPEEWITDSGHANADEVRASGFVEGMRQQIASGGVNLAGRFENEAQAQAEAEFELPPVPDIKIRRFDVPGMPGAIAAKKSVASRADVIAATQLLCERLE